MLRLMRNALWTAAVVLVFSGMLLAQDAVEYKLIATNKTSTSQKEMNEAAAAGFRFGGVMGGETSFGGSEVVTIMYRMMGGETSFGGSEVVTIMYRMPSDEKGRFTYKLLATNKTSTMQKELQAAGNEGFEYKGQSVYQSTFGGKEVVVILELDRTKKDRPEWDYKLLATSKTSTMQKELTAAGAEGFEFVGVTVGDTAIGGREVVSILRRVRK